jgi:hypothetical protein
VYEVASHVSDNWPLGRGIWYSDDMNRLVIWINEHDHIRVTSTEEVQMLVQLIEVSYPNKFIICSEIDHLYSVVLHTSCV